MAQPRSDLDSSAIETTSNMEHEIVLDKKFKQKIVGKLSPKTTKKFVEINYLICFGYKPEDLDQAKISIENLQAHVKQENNSGNNSYKVTLKVRIFNNEKNTDEQNKEFHNLAKEKNVFAGLKDDQIINSDVWRITDKAREAASKSFYAYYSRSNIKKTLDELFEQDAIGFRTKHPEYSKEEVFAHYIKEIIDIIAFGMDHNDANPYADGLDKQNKDKYVIAVPEHDLCRAFYTIVKNAAGLHYDNTAFTTLTPPQRLPTVKNVRPKENKSDPIDITNDHASNNRQRKHSSPRTANHSIFSKIQNPSTFSNNVSHSLHPDNKSSPGTSPEDSASMGSRDHSPLISPSSSSKNGSQKTTPNSSPKNGSKNPTPPSHTPRTVAKDPTYSPNTQRALKLFDHGAEVLVQKLLKAAKEEKTSITYKDVGEILGGYTRATFGLGKSDDN